MKTSNIIFLIALLSIFTYSCEETVELPTPEPSVTLAPLPLAISSSTCTLQGESLTVINPDTQDFEAYASDDFSVEWLTGDGKVAGTSHRLECACGKTFKAVVTELATGVSAEIEHTAIDCDDE